MQNLYDRHQTKVSILSNQYLRLATLFLISVRSFIVSFALYDWKLAGETYSVPLFYVTPHIVLAIYIGPICSVGNFMVYVFALCKWLVFYRHVNKEIDVVWVFWAVGLLNVTSNLDVSNFIFVNETIMLKRDILILNMFVDSSFLIVFKDVYGDFSFAWIAQEKELLLGHT